MPIKFFQSKKQKTNSVFPHKIPMEHALLENTRIADYLSGKYDCDNEIYLESIKTNTSGIKVWKTLNITNPWVKCAH